VIIRLEVEITQIMAAPRDFRGVVIDQHLDRIFQSVLGGEAYDLDALLARLSGYQADAERMEDVYVRARVHSVRGTILLTRFRLAEAEEDYHCAMAYYAAAGSERTIGMESNLALLRLQRGDYHGAVAMFDALIASVPPDSPRRSDVSLNAALALLPLFRWDEALEILLPTLEDYGEKIAMLRGHLHDGTYILEQRAALGMAQLGAGLTTDAIDSARLAVEFTRHVQTDYARGLAFCLLLRLACEGQVAETPDALLSHLDAIAQPTTDLYTFCLLRDEARYYTWRGITPDVAAWLVERARAIADAHASAELHASIDAALAV
jgi:tetratricopeptide (TPR) repeat protein